MNQKKKIMSDIKIKLPEYFSVQLGNTKYDLNTEALVSSMSHQFISQTTNTNNFSNYDIIYNVAKDEIEEYLCDLNEKNINEINLFGNWIDDFKAFHSKKNEPICRDIVFSFSNKSKWSVKILDLLSLKENYELTYIDYDDPLLTDDDKLMDYIGSLDWDTVKDIAEEIEKPQPEPNYDDEWKICAKEIVLWENSIDLIDFLEVDDILELDDIPDDKSS